MTSRGKMSGSLVEAVLGSYWRERGRKCELVFMCADESFHMRVNFQSSSYLVGMNVLLGPTRLLLVELSQCSQCTDTACGGGVSVCVGLAEIYIILC